jgi:HSP20 family protein
MTLVRWDPFRDMHTLHERLNRLLSDSRWSSDEGYGDWAPAVDIFEKGDDLVIRAELPGIERDDIDIRVENGTLTLRGERKQEKEIQEDKIYRMERIYGTFTRSFRLPTMVDASKIKAVFKNGVLEVQLPKAEEARPRKVNIQVA